MLQKKYAPASLKSYLLRGKRIFGNFSPGTSKLRGARGGGLSRRRKTRSLRRWGVRVNGGGRKFRQNRSAA
jgi:hypothetical protein